MAGALLDIRGLEKTFPGVKALKGVSLSIRQGEVHALMGENGAGKSTLIKVLTGIYQRSGGTIVFDGEEINCRTPMEANSKGISTIYQELNLVTFQTVYENLFLGRELLKTSGRLDRPRMIREAESILSDLGIHIDVTAPLRIYSTAIRQMVAIARAVSARAKLVIMDEPTSSLDEKEVSTLFRIIRKLKSQGISVLFISHKLDEVFEICERLTVLKDGEYVGSYNIQDIDPLRLVSLMLGRDAVQARRRQHTEIRDKAPLLAVQGIRQGMRLSGVDIDIRPGEVVGLAGLLGSGRTELARILFGVTKPDNGTVFWHGRPTHTASPADAIRKGMGYCTEDRKVEGIIPHLSVKENITIALLPKLNTLGFVKTRTQNELVDRYIERLGIKTPSSDQAICNLSGGNQQKVLLARWLCMNPQLMIMDEPTRGIDVGAKAEIEKLIRELADNGIAVLMISSELAELERNCDRVFVLKEGRKAGELAGDNITQKNIMRLIAADEQEERRHA